jgi:hypothetical protein
MQRIRPLISSLVVVGAACLPVHCDGKLRHLMNHEPTNPTLSEIQAKSLGLKVEAFDPSGKNIEHTGEPGELVCTRPHPSLPLYFWNDATGQKLREAYFSTFPGVWTQVASTPLLKASPSLVGATAYSTQAA